MRGRRAATAGPTTISTTASRTTTERPLRRRTGGRTLDPTDPRHRWDRREVASRTMARPQSTGQSATTPATPGPAAVAGDGTRGEDGVGVGQGADGRGREFDRVRCDRRRVGGRPAVAAAAARLGSAPGNRGRRRWLQPVGRRGPTGARHPATPRRASRHRGRIVPHGARRGRRGRSGRSGRANGRGDRRLNGSGLPTGSVSVGPPTRTPRSNARAPALSEQRVERRREEWISGDDGSRRSAIATAAPVVGDPRRRHRG